MLLIFALNIVIWVYYSKLKTVSKCNIKHMRIFL